MKTIVIAVGAAAMLMTAGVAEAKTHKKHHKSGSVAAAESPPRPIPYAQLDAYLSASPKERASNDWWSGQSMASTGANTNAAATSSDMSSSSSSMSGSVNAPSDTAPSTMAPSTMAPSTAAPSTMAPSPGSSMSGTSPSMSGEGSGSTTAPPADTSQPR